MCSSDKEIKMREECPPLKISEIIPNKLIKRLIIIGDIHGCYDEFIALLETINYSSTSDFLIAVGDLICKGPYSTKIIDFFINGENCLAVMGNHEYAVVSWHQVLTSKPNQLPCGLKKNSEHEKLAKILTPVQSTYLKNLPHIIKIPSYDLIITHAGINPQYQIKNNTSYDVMNIRNILNNGQGSAYVNSGHPWVTDWKGQSTIIFGHDALRGIQKTKNAIGLDTGCVYGKDLTCVIYPDEKIISVPAFKKYL